GVAAPLVPGIRGARSHPTRGRGLMLGCTGEDQPRNRGDSRSEPAHRAYAPGTYIPEARGRDPHCSDHASAGSYETAQRVKPGAAQSADSKNNNLILRRTPRARAPRSTPPAPGSGTVHLAAVEWRATLASPGRFIFPSIWTI